ncbi:hypothetical protein U14_02516 [Candidatus Moduliflexus flocculans]|uniref:PASTA domain-containing protein n=1 Tax=Candidatus Moduliflexus flocculans TaxID=1499966 RepID=A0A081BLK7_9BACT|nr:hypothetical protein U14_02516 [Candidatus Moduliflexus flocculans]
MADFLRSGDRSFRPTIRIMKKYLFFCGVALLMLVIVNAVSAENNVIVPNVNGIPHDVAAHLLRIAGLKPIVKFDQQRSLIITQQQPKPGMLVVAGTEVIISTGSSSESQIAVLPAQTVQPETSYVTVVPQQYDTTRSVTIASTPNQPAATQRASQTTGALPWYPKKFLGPAQDVQIQGILRNPASSSGTSNILGATPYSQQSPKPVILRSVHGWQEGWYVQGWEPGKTTGTSSSAGNQILGGSSGESSTLLSGEMAIVPPILYLPVADAASALRKAGLSVGSVVAVDDPQAQRGVVTQQSPSVRSVVPRGTAVQLWVAN